MKKAKRARQEAKRKEMEKGVEVRKEIIPDDSLRNGEGVWKYTLPSGNVIRAYTRLTGGNFTGYECKVNAGERSCSVEIGKYVDSENASAFLDKAINKGGEALFNALASNKPCDVVLETVRGCRIPEKRDFYYGSTFMEQRKRR